MKLLLDENLPHELRRLLMPMHEVFTVAYMGWSSLENGELLSEAASRGFDALLTKDQGIEHEQNLTSLPVAVVQLRVKTNKIDDIRPLAPAILSALQNLPPKSLMKIG